jgi:hypothetical protein
MGNKREPLPLFPNLGRYKTGRMNHDNGQPGRTEGGPTFLR